MTVTPTISALELFRIFQKAKGDEVALEVMSMVESSFALGDRGERSFPTKPIGLIDQYNVKTAISLAIGTKVAEIAEWSLSDPSIKEATRAVTLPWRRNRWIQGMLKTHSDHLNDFFGRYFGETAALWAATAPVARTFSKLAAAKLGLNMILRYRVEHAVRESLYAYLVSIFKADARVNDLKTLVQMLPFIVPICATDEQKKHWIVITA
jgi:hypothetical protein